MKRIWFTQQKRLRYIPLRLGLGYINEKEAHAEMTEIVSCPRALELCPKIYTTRTHPLSGEYIVVEASRFKAKPVVPEIRFKVSKVVELNLHGVLTVKQGNEFDFSWKTFPEKDLGVKGATFEQLRDELLRLNPNATIDTPFFVNLLEKIGENQ